MLSICWLEGSKRLLSFSPAHLSGHSRNDFAAQAQKSFGSFLQKRTSLPFLNAAAH
jgi:hypothetical protein